MNPTNEMPLGFGMALAQNEKALSAFGSMPEARQHELAAKATQARSKQEMQNLVNSIAP